MKLKHIFLGAIALLALSVTSGCVDEVKFGNSFLEKAPGGDVTKDTIFNNAEYTRDFLWNTYSKLYYGLPYYWDGGVGVKMNTGVFEALSDSWHSHNSWDEVNRQFYSGTYLPGNAGKFNYSGENVWSAVRAAYIFLENVDKTPGIDDAEKTRLKAEAKCIIASRYFDMFRHYGGLPIAKQSFDGTEGVYDLPRATVEETVNFMVKLLDEAAPQLPWVLDEADRSNWDGRFTKAAAMGLKCKILVFAASPLFNSATPYCTTGNQEANDKHQSWYGGYKPELWTACLQACKDFFDAVQANGYYQLVQAAGTTPGQYRAAFRNAYSSRGTTEMLISTRVKYKGYAGDWSDWDSKFVTEWNGFGGYTPTEDYMEMFSWKDGRPFDFNKESKNNSLDTMFVNKDKNFDLTRDPRLYETMIVNNVQWSLNDNGNMSGRRGELWINGREASSGPSSESGQYATGLANNKFYMNKDDEKGRVTCWPYLRLSEMYLIYAEALAQNNSFDDAIKQVNVVRSRVGLKGLKESQPETDFNDKTNLINAILNERACELGFEDTRFFDMIRYRRADLFERTLHGLRIFRQKDGKDYNFSYSDKKQGSEGWEASQPTHFRYEKFPLGNVARVWWTNFDTKWYLSAFPPTEINKGYGLTQNPGW